MSESNRWEAKGLLNPKASEEKFEITRHFPSAALSHFVKRYWIIHWDLRDQPPYRQEMLPYPCFNLVIERGKSAVFGVETGKSFHVIEGQGCVFGVKFHPGGFYPFLKQPAAQFANRSVSFREVFGVDSQRLEDTILPLTDTTQMIALMEDFLCAHLPEPDENVTLIRQIVDYVIANRTVTKVDDVVERFSISKRTLQRLFSQYVGASPKWVIKRYRLHEAADQLAVSPVRDYAKMALELGYFDQAHFIKDFKTMVGISPLEYARSMGRA